MDTDPFEIYMFKKKRIQNMKKIAIPVLNGILSIHFGHCDDFQIFDTEGQKIRNSVT
ncbi:unnamed protein product, partial [marine sediment metagenome]